MPIYINPGTKRIEIPGQAGRPELSLGRRAAAERTYAQILFEDYGADATWPLVNIASGTTIYDAFNSDRDGTLSGWVLQDAVGPVSGSLAPLSDAGDYGDIYTTAPITGLTEIFDGSVGSLLLWLRVSSGSVWTDGNNYFALQLSRGSASGRIYIAKVGDNNIRFGYTANDERLHVDHTISDTGWFSLGLSWSDAGNDGEGKMFANGQQVGSITITESWIDVLSSDHCAVLARDVFGGLSWPGWGAYLAARFGEVWTPTQFQEIHDAASSALADDTAAVIFTAPADLSDDFDDNSIADYYTTFISDDGSVVEQNQRMEMFAGTDVAGAQHAQIYTQEKWLLDGDFDVQVSFEGYNGTNNIYLKLHEPAPNDGTPDEEARVVLASDLGSPYGYGFEVRVGGSPGLLDGAGTYVDTSDTSGRFRVTRTGSTVEGFYWDGNNWVSIATATATTGPLSVMLWVSDGASVNFDDLIANADSVVMP